MKILLIMICFISFIQLTVAQNYNHEFGTIDQQEIDLKRYAKDTSAEAIFIYDIGKSYLLPTDVSFDVFFERRMKIKIFNKAGIKWAQNSIPYYEAGNKKEEIYDLKGNTYNVENGSVKITPLDPKNVFTEKYTGQWFFKKFAMPDVKEGSVIEISYKIRGPFTSNYRNWVFQSKLPVIYSEYTAKMTPFYEYQYILQGAKKFDEFKSSVDRNVTLNYQDNVYVFVMKDLPAFRDETFITSPQDYITKIDFQLAAVHRTDLTNVEVMTTWPKLSEGLTYFESFGIYLKDCKKESKKITDTIQFASKPDIEKAKLIDRFVKSHFKWNGKSDKYATQSAKDFLTSKAGNCADMNLFLAGMLNAAGIEAYPVILSTRSHGKVKLNYPFSFFFDYVIVEAKIDSASYLLDATEPLSNFNEIPTRCLNEKGLIIQKNKIEWVSLKSDSVSSIAYDINLRFNPGMDSVYQSSSLNTTGYDAIDYRNQCNSSAKKVKVKILGNNPLPGETLKTKNLNSLEKPFTIAFNKKAAIETVEDKIIVSPFCDYTLTENPLKQPTRNYPVDFIYKKKYAFNSTIKIPGGYKLLTKPEDLKVDNPMIKIAYSTAIQNNGSISVMGSYEFKKDVYETPYYLELKDYFSMIIDKFNEKLVLVKN